MSHVSETPMTQTSVSVIVPVLNGEQTIGRLIHALLAQRPPGGTVDLIVVDNGSSDRTRSILASFPEGSLTVLEEPKRGPSAARNRGLAAAHGELIALLDADCVPTRSWLRELVAPFADPDVVIVAGGLASYPPKTAAQRFAAQYGLNDATRAVTASPMPFANTRNMCVRRDAAVAVGGWPEELPEGEDIEFSFRIRERFGVRIEYRPSAVAFHEDRADDEALRTQAFGYGRGMAALYARHPDLLPWGPLQRLRRIRTSARRQIGAVAGTIAQRMGRADPESVEFASYLARWDRWFWQGFSETRRRGSGQA